MAVTTYDGLIARISNGYSLNLPFFAEVNTVTVNPSVVALPFQLITKLKALPSPLPTGVTGYIPTSCFAFCSESASYSFLFAKLIDFGTVDLTQASGSHFTDGVVMPTNTELNASNVTASAVIIEVTSALTATPSTIILTYTDQDGNTSQTSQTVTMGASAPIKTSWWQPLAAGDWGARDITGVTLGTYSQASGALAIHGILPIGMCTGGIASPGNITEENLLTKGFIYNKLGAGDIVGVFRLGRTTTCAVIGNIVFIGDS